MGLRQLVYGLYERRLAASLPPPGAPRHVGVILDGNRRWARAVRRGCGRGAPGRGGPDPRLPRLVRGRRRRAGHALAAVDRQPGPAPTGAGRPARHHRGRRRAARRRTPLAGAPGRRARPAAGVDGPPAEGVRGVHARRPGDPRQRRDRLRRAARDRGRRPLAPARPGASRAARSRSWPRSSTSSTSPSTSTPAASPIPTSSSAPRASSGCRASCSGRARTASSTSARRCGPTSARSTSCARCVLTHSDTVDSERDDRLRGMSRSPFPVPRRALLVGGAGAAVAAAAVALTEPAEAAGLAPAAARPRQRGRRADDGRDGRPRGAAWQVSQRGAGVAAALYAQATAVLAATARRTRWGSHGRNDAGTHRHRGRCPRGGPAQRRPARRTPRSRTCRPSSPSAGTAPAWRRSPPASPTSTATRWPCAPGRASSRRTPRTSSTRRSSRRGGRCTPAAGTSPSRCGHGGGDVARHVHGRLRHDHACACR